MGFSDEFAAALPDIHAGLGEVMTYSPRIGTAVELIAVPNYQPSIRDAFGTGYQAPRLEIDVLLADVAQPEEGDGVTFEGKEYRVQGAPELNEDRLSWRILLVRAP